MNDTEKVVTHDTPIPAWAPIPASVTSAYSNITANDNSRIHNGHVYHFHQHCTVQSDQNDSAESLLQANLKRKRSLADIGTNPRTREAQESLHTVLKKLGKLSRSIRHRREGDEAEKIARRIAAIFDAITTYGDDEGWDRTTAQRIGKLGATVKWAQQFDINSVPLRDLTGRNARATTRRTIVETGRWNISLTTTTLDTQGEGGLREVKLFSALRIEPQHRLPGSALAVFFSEHTDGHFTSTIPPTVLAYNMVNNDAEVFYILKDDNLDGLLRLLASGEASIRDCDEYGRSLLHHACHWDSSQCCSFLIGRGVDIDRFELRFVDNNRPKHGYPLIHVSLLQATIRIPSANGIDSCFGLMWRAGADPTITASPGKILPPLFAALEADYSSFFTVQLIHACLKEGSPYIDFQEKFDSDTGHGYWLSLCLGSAVLEDPSLLQIFADKGADITETDENGFNCLFLFMSNACMPDKAEEFKALQSLLEVLDRFSVLDAMSKDIFAYFNELRDWPEGYGGSADDCGSYRQDLWYCALARSKLDFRFKVPPCDRIARYTKYYTPKYYLALCHLDDWDSWNKVIFERQIQPVLQEHPLSEDEERIQQEMDALLWWGSESDSTSSLGEEEGSM